MLMENLLEDKKQVANNLFLQVVGEPGPDALG
jgi:hypothetical protein